MAILMMMRMIYAGLWWERRENMSERLTSVARFMAGTYLFLCSAGQSRNSSQVRSVNECAYNRVSTDSPQCEISSSHPDCFGERNWPRKRPSRRHSRSRVKHHSVSVFSLDQLLVHIICQKQLAIKEFPIASGENIHPVLVV